MVIAIADIYQNGDDGPFRRVARICDSDVELVLVQRFSVQRPDVCVEVTGGFVDAKQGLGVAAGDFEVHGGTGIVLVGHLDVHDKGVRLGAFLYLKRTSAHST